MVLRSGTDKEQLVKVGYLGSYPSYPVSTNEPDLSAIRRADLRAQDDCKVRGELVRRDMYCPVQIQSPN